MKSPQNNNNQPQAEQNTKRKQDENSILNFNEE